MNRSNTALARRLGRIAGALALWLAVGCEPPPNARVETPDAPRPRATGVATPPLEVGAALPPLQAEGWVNGPPPAPGAAGTRLLVVDVWGTWCPYCARSAPELVQLHKKYADRGVAFVSITNTHRGVVEGFVRRHALTWANGYGASPETIAALGAGSGMTGPPEYESAPTVYLVGPDGRVRWTDGRGRMKHEEPDAWARKLDAAIADALAPAKN